MKDLLNVFEHGEKIITQENISTASDKEKFSIGSIITVRVIGIYEHFVEVGSEKDGHYIGSIHISKIRDAYIKDLYDYFYINQNINVLIEDNDEIFGYQLKYENIRQPTGMKVNTIIIAEITEPFDSSGRKFRCIFPDFENAPGVVFGIPKGYVVNTGDRLPVMIADIKQGLPITKF